MILSKTYQFQEWNNWDHSLANAIDDFFETYHLYPTILQCNVFTYSQIDFITNINPEKRKNVSPIDDVKKHVEDIQLAIFLKGTCELRFAVDEKLEVKLFSLIFDDEPDWGDDDENNLPVNDLNINKIKIKVE